MKSLPKPSLILVSTIILTIIAIIVLINIQPVTTYGTIKKVGNALISRTEVINCEALKKDLRIINPFSANQHLEETIGIKGYKLLNYLIILSLNSSYNPKKECFAIHKHDVISQLLNYTVNAKNPTLLEYNITNYADNRLFYEARLVSDCEIVQATFTGYLDPEETQKVFFNVSCSQGIHESTIETVFVDELVNYHYETKEIIITSV